MLTENQIDKLIKNNKMIFCFDIDDTICKMIDLIHYKPYKNRIKYVNKLHDDGNYIYLLTARKKHGTKKLLKEFGLKYNEIIFGKPKAHIYVDDSAINNDYWKNREFFNKKYKRYGNNIHKIVCESLMRLRVKI